MWRRVAFSLAVAVAAGAACAEPRLSGHYQLYIYEPLSGPKVYALGGAAGASAAEIVGCTGRVVSDARAIVERLAARAARNDEDDENNRADDLDLVTVSIGGSIHLGSCHRRDESDEDADKEDDEPGDALVILEEMNARQATTVINEMDALSREQRAQMRAELGLR